MGRFDAIEIDPGKQRDRFASIEIDPGKKRGKFDSIMVDAPKGGDRVSLQDYTQAIGDKSGTLGSMLKGFTHNYDEYASAFTKLIGDEQAHKYWERQRKLNEIQTHGHDTAKLVGEVALDPVNLLPAGIFTKGAKAARVAKSALGGAALGGGMTVVHDYGRDTLSTDEKAERGALGSGVGAGVNALVAALTRGHVRELPTERIVNRNRPRGTTDRARSRQIAEALLNNPEEVGLVPNVPREEYAPNFIMKDAPRPELVKKGMKNVSDAMRQLHVLQKEGKYNPNPIQEKRLPAPADRWDEITIPASAEADRWDKIAIEHQPDERGFYNPEGNLLAKDGEPAANVPDDYTLAERYAIENEDTLPLDEGALDFDFGEPKNDIGESVSIIHGKGTKGSGKIALKDEETGITTNLHSSIEDAKAELDAMRADKERFRQNGEKRAADTLKHLDMLRATGEVPLELKSIHGIDPEKRHIPRSEALPALSEIFGIPSREVGKLIKDHSSTTLTDTGAKRQWVDIDGAIKELAGAIEPKAEKAAGRYDNGIYSRAYDALERNEVTTQAEQQALPLEGVGIQNPLFSTGPVTNLETPKWAKPIVSDTTRYEDIISALREAKGGRPNELADRAIDAMQKDSSMAERIMPREEAGPTLFDENMAGAPMDEIPDYSSMSLEELQNDPLFNYVVERARGRKATDIRYGKKLLSPATIRHTAKNGEGWTTDYTKAIYEPNYEADFTLTKSDVKKIEKGNITPEIEAKIRQDMETMVNHPDWNDEGLKILAEADKVFANGTRNLAAGAGLGTLNAVSGEYDPNRDMMEQISEKFWEGMLAGTVGSKGIEMLAKKYPQAFERLKQHIVENDIKPGEPVPDNAVRLGMFGGSAPRGGQGGSDRFDHVRRLVEKNFSREWGSIEGGFKNEIKSLFTNTLSGEYMAKREAVQAGRAKAAREAKKLHHFLKDMPEQDRKMLHEYIVGDIDDAPDHIKQLGERVRQTVHGIQRELLDAGVMTEDAINAWGENYLRRIYEPHLLKDGVGSLRKSLTQDPILRRGKVETMTVDEFKDKLQSGEIDPNKVRFMEDQTGSPGDELIPGFYGNDNITLKDGGYEVRQLPGKRVEVRRDWTKQEREAMGEVTDAAVTIPETILKMRQLVEHAKFLKEISEVDGAVVLPDEAGSLGEDALKSSGFVKLGSDPKYGPLAGQWVRRDVADDIKGLNDRIFNTFLGSESEVGRAWMQYLSWWKKSKTVWNAPTHFNNLTSNFFLMNLAGLMPHEIAYRVGKAGKMMYHGKRLLELEKKQMLGTATPEELREIAGLQQDLRYLEEAQDMGLLNMSHLEDINIGNQRSFYTERSKLGKLDDKLSNIYQAEDGVNKLAMYSLLRDKGWSKTQARRAVETIMPDYSAPMPRGWQALRDTGVTPFISWTYYTFPKIVQMLDPRNSPRGFANSAATLAGLYALSYAATGIWNPYDEDMPEDFQAKRLPIMRNGNDVMTMKIDRMIPYLQLANPFQTGREIATQGVPQSLLGLLAGVRLYNGRPITGKSKPLSQQYYDVGKYAVQQLTPIPGQLSTGWDFVESMVRSKKNRKRSSEIVPRETWQEILRMFPGINTLTYDEEKVRRGKHYIEKAREEWH